MGDHTKIEWTDASWTPIRARNRTTGKVGWHCEHVSEGCRNCYAEGMNNRLGTGLPFKPGHLKDVSIYLDQDMLIQPMRWKKPRRIFVCSMTDLFASFVSDDFIDRMFAVMALCPQHTFQILTKRPERLRPYIDRAFDRIVMAMMEHTDQGYPSVRQTCEALGLPWTQPRSASDWWPLRNVWLGTSVEDQDAANLRVPYLLTAPAAIRFLSCEPLLGPVDLAKLKPDVTMTVNALTGRAEHLLGNRAKAAPLNWVIVGGESGRGARPMHPAWARQLRDQCAAASVAFHFKQWGEWTRHKLAPGSDLGGDVGRGTIRIVHAGGETDVEVSELTGGRNTLAGSLYMARVGKAKAGRLLDGVEHNGFPT